MRPGGVTSGTHGADSLLLTHALTGFNVAFGQVQILGLIFFAMLTFGTAIFILQFKGVESKELLCLWFNSKVLLSCGRQRCNFNSLFVFGVLLYLIVAGTHI